MMRRLLSVLALCLLICIPGIALIWVVGAYTSCLFVSGCYERLGVVGVLGVISIKSILAKGTLLALAFTFLTWLKIR
ncbi:MAG TPA: hypothetical protein VHI52_20470 [Verrucomicrobiae bacterium]|nr:hypothetical protein [Verrucomicrobiae bacterium]